MWRKVTDPTWSYRCLHVGDSGQKQQPATPHTSYCPSQEDITFIRKKKKMCVQFQYLPGNDGRHLPPPPPQRKQKVQQSRDPSPRPPYHSQRHTESRLEERETERKGEERGMEGQIPKQQAWESYQVTRERKNSHNRHAWRCAEDIARWWRGSLTARFFSQGTSAVLCSHALWNCKTDYTSLQGRGGNSWKTPSVSSDTDNVVQIMKYIFNISCNYIFNISCNYFHHVSVEGTLTWWK